MGMIQCPNCKKSVSDSNRTCPFCLEPLAGGGRLPEPEAEPEPDEPNEDAGGDAGNDAGYYTAEPLAKDPLPENPLPEKTEKKTASGFFFGRKASVKNEEEHSDFHKKHNTKPAPGRKLFGFRSGRLPLIYLSLLFYMTSAVWFLSLVSEMTRAFGSVAVFFHTIRVISIALVLYLPLILYSGKPLTYPRRSDLNKFAALDAVLLLLFVLCSMMLS